MFLKVAAQAFESGDFLNIFLRFWGFLRLIFLEGSDVKYDLKVEQLAWQPPTLKTLMQKILVGL